MFKPAALALALLLIGCADGAAPFAADEAPASSATAEGSRGLAAVGGQPGAPAIASRRLIKTGELRVVVDEYEPLQAALNDKLAALGGFIADSDLSHNAGRVGYATLVLRVPADRFDELLAWTGSQVEVQGLTVDTADVTERWVDVQARIDNGERTEARLLGLLDTGAARLEDVLAVERELSRVRGEVEAAQGQMRVLKDQVGLATLTLRASVRSAYEPQVALAYHARVGAAFTGSVSAMGEVAQGLGIVLVATLPWLAVLAIFGWLAFGIVRRLWRRVSA